MAGEVSSPQPIQTDSAPIMRLIKYGLSSHHVETETATTVPIYPLNYLRRTVPARHVRALRYICTALPLQDKMRDIIHSRSDWWQSWRVVEYYWATKTIPWPILLNVCPLSWASLLAW
ncbi:hypothetical protein BDV29DRAFT_153700 [Aspergillus leporis]|uniref:Uncharacterized protein n=1 Tax=Aspergillus leporis TaxID=41062 RepID=A0A5N5XA12_9EURO|nr:hypothetical protein BDV29DRAFT_153700 [Aspergillus leporis]